METKKLIAQHYKAFWGQPASVYEIDFFPETGLKDVFYVAEFGPTPNHDVWTYATFGVSQYLMPGQFPIELGSPSQRRIEIVAYASPPYRGFVDFIGQLAMFPFINRTVIWAGHTIPGNKSIVAGSSMTCVYFTFPSFENQAFQPICLDGEHIYILWAVPIYETERQYKITNGVEAFENLFDGTDVPLWNLQRKPVI